MINETKLERLGQKSCDSSQKVRNAQLLGPICLQLFQKGVAWPGASNAQSASKSPLLQRGFQSAFPPCLVSPHHPGKTQGRCSSFSLFIASETKIPVTHPRSQNRGRKGTHLRPAPLTFIPVFRPPCLSNPSRSFSSSSRD